MFSCKCRIQLIQGDMKIGLFNPTDLTVFRNNMLSCVLRNPHCYRHWLLYIETMVSRLLFGFRREQFIDNKMAAPYKNDNEELATLWLYRLYKNTHAFGVINGFSRKCLKTYTDGGNSWAGVQIYRGEGLKIWSLLARRFDK